MNALEKSKYQKAKYTVKKWENEFKKKCGRLPSKVDIKAAASKIRDAYRTYWTLKTSCLESSLLDVTLDENASDSFSTSLVTTLEKTDPPISFNPDDSQCFKPLSDITFDTSNLSGIIDLDKTDDSLDISIDDGKFKVNTSKPTGIIAESSNNLFGKLDAIKIPKSIWGEHLNKNLDSKKGKALKQVNSISTLYAQKLFMGSKFKKRNPLKPRELQRSKTSEDLQTSEPSIETCGPFSQPNLGSLNEMITHGSESMNEVSAEREKIHESETHFNLLNEKMKVVIKSTPTCSQNISLLQSSLDDSGVVKARTFNPGWVERVCEKKESEVEKRNSFDSGIDNQMSSSSKIDFSESKECSTQTQSNHQDVACDSGEDLIYDSDSESQNLSQSVITLFNPTIKPKMIGKIKTPLGEVKEKEPPKRKINEVEAVTEAIPFKRMKSEFAKRLLKGEPITDIVDKIDDTVQEQPYPHHKTKTEKKKDILEKKILSGKANENFIRINIKKKVYVRGKKRMHFSTYKKKQWQKKNKFGAKTDGGSGILLCFKCGEPGHFANACLQGKKEEEIEEFEEECELPTLEEAEEMAREHLEKANISRRKHLFIFQETEEICGEGFAPPDILKPNENVEPLFKLNEDGTLIDTPPLVFKALKDFKLKEFRTGQEKAIMRILSGLSTLVTLATGTGKSLCYQLPAYIYAKHSKSITLVISPLVSLMEDQVYCGARCLKVACLHTNQSKKAREAVMEELKSGRLSVLLVSPEALASGDKAASSFLRHLPPIAFACVDEAHCVSQWSHNFRPSYLSVCQVLRERLGVRTILGLTATATCTTVGSILEQFGLDKNDSEAVISDIPLPNNLYLSVSSDEDRDSALLRLLSSTRFEACDSIIVYCTRREQCDRIAVFLRTSLKSIPQTSKRSRISFDCEAYHAGLSAARRKQVQNAFMSGKLRIVVATVAFGMGINKNDIRAIVHYNMPSSFESYVQEVGRAGRDGRPAHCHLFLDSRGRDLAELRRHIYTDSVDRHTLRKLLQSVFVSCKCGEGQCNKHEVAFSIDATIKALDLPQENILTLLAYLELHERKWIKVLTPVYTECKITSYKGAMHLRRTAKTCPPLAVAMAMAANSGQSLDSITQFEFDIMQLARLIDWDSGIVKNTLKSLEWITADGKPQKSGIVVDLKNLGFRLLTPGDLSGEELDAALDVLHGSVQNHEETRLKQLQVLFNSLQKASHATVDACLKDVVLEKCEILKASVRHYFQDQNGICSVIIEKNIIENEEDVAVLIRQLITSYCDVNFTGRSIARILHGIGSPNFPPLVWSRNRFWRSQLNCDFNDLCKLATKQLILMR